MRKKYEKNKKGVGSGSAPQCHGSPTLQLQSFDIHANSRIMIICGSLCQLLAWPLSLGGGGGPIFFLPEGPERVGAADC
jgi:hypothetical protein